MMMMMREGRLIEKHGLQHQTLCHLLLPRACFLHKKKKKKSQAMCGCGVVCGCGGRCLRFARAKKSRQR